MGRGLGVLGSFSPPCLQQAAHMKKEAQDGCKETAKPSSEVTAHFFSGTGHSSWPFLSLKPTPPGLTGRVQ